MPRLHIDTLSASGPGEDVCVDGLAFIVDSDQSGMGDHRVIRLGLPIESPDMRVSIVVPTWQRSRWLNRCLGAIMTQGVLPDEILVVGGVQDAAAQAVVKNWRARSTLPVRWVEVHQPGYVLPVRRGLEETRGDVVVFIDDDAEPTEGWLQSLLAPFGDECVACVGGRVETPGWKGRVRRDAGRIRWYGRHVGNIGAMGGVASRDVDAVMEGNWAWRSAVARELDFDPVFFQDDASMYGLDLCLQAKERGYRILYQPRASVLHHVAPRDPTLDREERPKRTVTYSRNYTYIALRHFLGFRLLAFLAWWWVVGERGSYGVATALYDLVAKGPGRILPLVRASWKGKWEGVRAWQAVSR